MIAGYTRSDVNVIRHDMDVINVNAAVIDPTSLTLFQSGNLAQVVPVGIYEATLGCILLE